MSTVDRRRRRQNLEFSRLTASKPRGGRFLDVNELLRSHDNKKKNKRRREDDLKMTTATTMNKKKAAKTTSFFSLSSVVTHEPLSKSQHALSNDDHNNNNKRRRQDDPKTATTATKKNKKTANTMPFFSLSSLVSDEPLSKAQHAKRTSLKKKKKKKKNEREEARASFLAMQKDVEVNVDDNFKTMNELKRLCGGHEVVMGSSLAIDSWDLGLRLKKDYDNDNDGGHVGVTYSHDQPVKLPPILSPPPPPPPTAETLSLKETIFRAKDIVLKRKREAARASLLAMEKEVDIDDNFKTMNDFKKLIGGRELVMGLF